MKIAVITGASSGLGAEFLNTVINEYPNLDEYWIIARRKDRLEKLAQKYKTKRIVTVTADLSDMESYKGIAELLKQAHPVIKVLINNAGYAKSGAFSQMESSDILNMISVNIKGMTMIQKICLPYMRAGSFTVITCSVSSFVPVPNQAIYSASKKYVYYWGKALREELIGKDINILLLCPGNMDTEMNPKGQDGKAGGLPFLDMKKITLKALKKAARGSAVYTPGAFYKLYRVTGKLAPSSLMVKIVKRYFN